MDVDHGPKECALATIQPKPTKLGGEESKEKRSSGTLGQKPGAGSKDAVKGRR